MAEKIVIDIELELKKINSEMKKLTDSMNEKVKKQADDSENILKRGFGRAFTSIKKDFAGLATAFVAGAGLRALVGQVVQARREFSEFENDITAVKTLLNDKSFGSQSLEEGFKGLQSGVLDLIREIPVDLKNVNKSLFDTVSAGVNAGEALNVVASAGKLAVAGVTDIAVATDGITTAMNAFGLGAEQAESIAAKFFEAQVKGKTTIQELGQGLGQVASTASTFGASLDEVLASVSAVATGGLKTNQAFTGLKAVFANIAQPSKLAIDQAKKLGIEFNIAGLKSKGFAGFIDEIKDKTKGSAQALKNLFGSTEAFGIVASLTGKQSKLFADNLKSISDNGAVANNFIRQYEIQSVTAANRAQLLNNTIQAFRIEVAQKLEPVFISLTKFVLTLVNGFRNLIDNGFGPLRKIVIATGLVFTSFYGKALAIGAINLISKGVLSIYSSFLKLRTGINLAKIAVNLFKAAATLGFTLILDAVFELVHSIGGFENALANLPLLGKFVFEQMIKGLKNLANAFLDNPITRFIAEKTGIDLSFQFDTSGNEETLDNLKSQIEAIRVSAEKPLDVFSGGGGDTGGGGGGDAGGGDTGGGGDVPLVGGGLDTGKLAADQQALFNFVTANKAFVESNRELINSTAESLGLSSTTITDALGSIQTKTAEVSETFSGLLADRDALTAFVDANREFIESNRELVFQTGESLGITTEQMNNALLSTTTNAQKISASFNKIVKNVKSRSIDLSKVIQNTLQKTIVQGTQVMVSALANGANAFKAFGKLALGLIGDFLIQIGQMAIAVAIAAFGVKKALENLNPYVALAAGVVLIALGTAFKALSSSGGGKQSTPSVPTGGGGGGGASSPSAPTTASTVNANDDDDDDPLNRGARVEVNIQGDVLDSDQTAIRIVDLIEEAGFQGANIQ